MRRIEAHVWGTPGSGPKVYVQAGLHADEMPGILVARHLIDRLNHSEREGRIAGEVWVVPLANPVGLAQWTAHKPQGRHELAGLQNFNRGFPDLAELAAPLLEGRLTDDAAENLVLIRQAFAEALRNLPRANDTQELRLCLLGWSHDADCVLDLHCDHEAILHFYAAPARPADIASLARSIGAELVLVQEVSGGNAFDEAHTAPWVALRRRFGAAHPIPDGCFSATVEYRGQADVRDDLAAEDAARLMVFLGAIGAVRGEPVPRLGTSPVLPLDAAAEVFAPQGGIVLWRVAPGDHVKKGEVMAEILDPVTGKRVPVVSPTFGLVFRIELWRSCLRGQSLAHVAGNKVIRAGNLMSD
ncbi:MAG: succinylglutamate desuccinylase/aspartoacylase family protein [Rubellimicrobium sp.]|nr:succinylglutamate desuccinylase/aspartoacylase family protein [Rubellimicrobium sp.]